MNTELLFVEDPYLQTFEADVISVEEGGVVLDKTAFYYMSGGQPGDTGILMANDNRLKVDTTIKSRETGQVLHMLAEGSALPQIGDKISGQVNWAVRHKLMQMHTSLHLLCSLVEGDVTGGQIGLEKSRLDFNIEAGAYDKEELTEKINALIRADHPVATRWITEEELALNPDLVRTMFVSPPSGQGRIRLVQIGHNDSIVDLQPCGGTHVKTTGEIAPLRVSKIENKGKQNRRISVVFDV